MNLKQQNDMSPLAIATPVLILLSGWIFCIVVTLFNVFILSLGDSVKADYLISKSYHGVNCFWLCEFMFAGFIALGLLSLIRGKGKICSATLIISCLAVATYAAVIKSTVKKGHMQRILVLEAALKRAVTEPAAEPCLSAVMSLYRGRYTELVELWNALHKNKYEPAAGLALSGAEQSKFMRHLLCSGYDDMPSAERANRSPQLLNPWRSISDQCSFIIDSVHQLASATNSQHAVIEDRDLRKEDNDEFTFRGEGHFPIGADGWFLYVSHSFHSDRSMGTDIGDLSIGRDHEGNCYFSHRHACVGHSFRIGPGKAYASMQDFLDRNTSWHLIANIDEWKSANTFVDPVSEAAR